MIPQSKTCTERSRSIENPKSKIVEIPPNVLVRADRVIS